METTVQTRVDTEPQSKPQPIVVATDGLSQSR